MRYGISSLVIIVVLFYLAGCSTKSQNQHEYLDKANSYYKRDDCNNYAKYLKLAIEHGEINEDTGFSNIATCYNNVESFDSAAVYLKRSLVHDSEDYAVNAKLAYSLIMLRKYSESKKYSQKAIQLNPDHPHGYYLWGLSNYYQQNFDSALTLFKKVDNFEIAKEEYYFENFLLYFGITYYNLGKYQQAVPYLTRLISKNESYLFAYYMRALARLKLHDYNGARQDLMFYLDNESSIQHKTYLRLFEVFIGLGERTQACQYYEKGIKEYKYDPNDAEFLKYCQ